MGLYKSAIFPIFERLDPEMAHLLTMRFLGLANRYEPVLDFIERMYRCEDDPRLHVELWEHTFPHPLGLAAGLDKNGAAPNVWFSLGYSSVEIGTLTPLPQKGRVRPRIFRYSDDPALINRMGFPNVGMDQGRKNLLRSSPFRGYTMANAGANMASVEAGRAVEDYLQVLENLYPCVNAVVINVSSPNTTRLRDLQGKRALTQLLRSILDLRNRLVLKHDWKPVLVKVAPDLSDPEIEEIADVCLEVKVDGIVATNTTIQRPHGLPSTFAEEIGGLSGKPLVGVSNRVIQLLYKKTGVKVPIVGVGGVFTAEDALQKILYGASLVQQFTGLIFEGPSSVRAIKQGLSERLHVLGVSNIMELRGIHVR